MSVYDRAHHLLLVGINGRHLEVEVNLRLCGLSADIHQTVYADGVVGKRVSYVQIAQTYTVNRINSLQIECSLIRIATEDYGSAAIKCEVLLNNVLYGYAVSAVVYGIGAEHVKRALVVERGA